MRDLLRRTILGAPLMAALVLVPAQAWARSSVMQVEVPFGFHAGAKTLPSGLYRVELGDDHTIRLTGPDGHQTLMMAPVRDFDDSGKESGLAFRKYGQDYFLARVVSRMGNGYYEWPPTNIEKVLAKRANVQLAWVRSLSSVTP